MNNRQNAPATGIATYREAMQWLGIKSRTTAISRERKGLIPKRVNLGNGKVGFRWADLHQWAENLPAAEGGEA